MSSRLGLSIIIKIMRIVENNRQISKNNRHFFREILKRIMGKNWGTRVLWNTYPVHCCCMELCETQLIAEEDYKFARTHTFALLTMVIALCTIKLL